MLLNYKMSSKILNHRSRLYIESQDAHPEKTYEWETNLPAGYVIQDARSCMITGTLPYLFYSFAPYARYLYFWLKNPITPDNPDLYKITLSANKNYTIPSVVTDLNAALQFAQVIAGPNYGATDDLRNFISFGYNVSSAENGNKITFQTTNIIGIRFQPIGKDRDGEFYQNATWKLGYATYADNGEFYQNTAGFVAQNGANRWGLPRLVRSTFFLLTADFLNGDVASTTSARSDIAVKIQIQPNTNMGDFINFSQVVAAPDFIIKKLNNNINKIQFRLYDDEGYECEDLQAGGQISLELLFKY